MAWPWVLLLQTKTEWFARPVMTGVAPNSDIVAYEMAH